MPGVWELERQNLVQVAILHVETATVAWAFGLRNLIIPGPSILPIAGMPYDHARNTACKIALERGCPWLFFLDSDVVPPADAILRLLSRNKPIISGVYCRRSPPHGLPVFIKDGKWGGGWRDNALVEADVVGAGCLLIHRSVLETLPPLDEARGKRWFDWRSDMGGMSEDFEFCNAARRAGHKIVVDTSVQCRHIGMCEAGLNSLKPLETVPVS